MGAVEHLNTLCCLGLPTESAMIAVTLMLHEIIPHGATRTHVPVDAIVPCRGHRLDFAFARPRLVGWHSPDNRECSKRVSWISCRDIRHSFYTDISLIICLLRLRLPRWRDAPAHQN
jgi:hypothetical protein